MIKYLCKTVSAKKIDMLNLNFLHRKDLVLVRYMCDDSCFPLTEGHWYLAIHENIGYSYEILYHNPKSLEDASQKLTCDACHFSEIHHVEGWIIHENSLCPVIDKKMFFKYFWNYSTDLTSFYGSDNILIPIDTSIENFSKTMLQYLKLKENNCESLFQNFVHSNYKMLQNSETPDEQQLHLKCYKNTLEKNFIKYFKTVRVVFENPHTEESKNEQDEFLKFVRETLKLGGRSISMPILADEKSNKNVNLYYYVNSWDKLQYYSNSVVSLSPKHNTVTFDQFLKEYKRIVEWPFKNEQTVQCGNLMHDTIESILTGDDCSFNFDSFKNWNLVLPCKVTSNGNMLESDIFQNIVNNGQVKIYGTGGDVKINLNFSKMYPVSKIISNERMLESDILESILKQEKITANSTPSCERCPINGYTDLINTEKYLTITNNNGDYSWLIKNQSITTKEILEEINN